MTKSSGKPYAGKPHVRIDEGAGRLAFPLYSTVKILQMVRDAVALSGGLDYLIQDGKTVMLKPNLVNWADFRPVEVNGVTTDYRVIQAVVQIVRELNPGGKIILAEGSGGRITTMENFQYMKYLDVTGIDEFYGFEEWSGEYQDYVSDSLVAIELPDELSLYPDDKKPNGSRKLYYNKKYYNVDVLISIPVLKNHNRAGITGGVKNIGIGATPANIYADKDFDRPYLRSTVIDHELVNLDKWIHDYYAGRPADFVIMDGLQGVSNGPGGGGSLNVLKTNQHNMRLILAGKNAISADAIAGLLIGHDPQKANSLVHLHNSNFGIVDPALIEVKGVKVHEIRKFLGFSGIYYTPTIFSDSVCDNYFVSCNINGNSLKMSVTNPFDLARMQVSVDGQKINKYIVGGFSDIELNIEGINVSSGLVSITFEDRYLNTRNKQFMANITSGINEDHISDDMILYPNPSFSDIYLSLKNTIPGNYNLSILSIDGRHINSKQLNGESGILNYNLNPGNLPKGNYIVKVTSPDKKTGIRRFVLQ
jgi:uncharacterized protein (DUF362 family)